MGRIVLMSAILLMLANVSCTTTGTSSTSTNTQAQAWPPSWVQVPEWARTEQEGTSDAPAEGPLVLVECKIITCPTAALEEVKLKAGATLAVFDEEGKRLAEALSGSADSSMLSAPQVLVTEGQHACVSLTGMGDPPTGIVWYLKPVEAADDTCMLRFSLQGNTVTPRGWGQQTTQGFAFDRLVKLRVGVWCVCTIQAQADERLMVIMLRVGSISDAEQLAPQE